MYMYCFFFNDTATTEIYTYDTLFPYTTLFRSHLHHRRTAGEHLARDLAAARVGVQQRALLRPLRDQRFGQEVDQLRAGVAVLRAAPHHDGVAVRRGGVDEVGARAVDAIPAQQRETGRAHVCTPVTNAHLVCRLLLEKKK